MGFYKAISIAALGIASYALYKTGALNPVIKTAAKASSKASELVDETIAKAKNKVDELKNKNDEPATDEI